MSSGSEAGGADPRVGRSRAVIRQAALDELAEAGYGAFTIESVAARAGAGKSTIYRHWRDKLDLIADAFESAHEHLVPAVADGTAADQIRQLVAHVAEVTADSTFSRCIPALIEGARHDRRLREFHHGYSARRRASLTSLISAGIATGEFAATIDPELAAQAILGAVFYGRLMAADPFDPARAGELVAAVLPPGGSAAARRPE
ncbi:MAG TPA: TetR/AcrR family transcriptional regulator [Streptosporangiaceae bacterium]|jgi:AcrR family transcriptional regulator